jgi:hypothetical protein
MLRLRAASPRANVAKDLDAVLDAVLQVLTRRGQGNAIELKERCRAPSVTSLS